MASLLKQSTAVTVKMGPFVDETDGKTQETALTIAQADIRLTKAGGAFAQTNNAAGATHDEKGNYGVPLNTTDTNTLGLLRVHIHVAGALPVWRDFIVVPAMVYDSLVAGTDRLDANVTHVADTAQTPGDLKASINALGLTILPQELRKYNTLLVTGSTAIRFSLMKVGGGAAGSGDWTPAAGDVKVSKDAGAEANVTNLPTFVNGAWELILTAAELSAKIITVRIADQGTKVIADAMLVVATFGNASAFFPDDIGTAAPTDASIADAVWDEALSGHGTAGSAGAGLTAAGSAGDPWSTALPGSYGAGTAGKILSDMSGDVTTLLSRITSTLFNGITSLAHWLGALAGKQAANATAQTEIRATGAGSGTYDPTTDSQEALRDRGDAAWITATGFSTLDAAGVRTAVGLASANLDTQLAAKAEPGDAMSLTADALDAASLAASAGTEIAAAVQTSAATTPLPSDVKKINATTITGTGVLGDEFGPA